MSNNSKLPKIIGWSAAIVGLTAVVLVIALVVIKTLFIGYYRIPQNGMYPSLPAGSFIFAAKRPYASPFNVERGDIVVFIRDEQGHRYNYIWRVVGLPGETVQTTGKSLTINGQPIQQQRTGEADGKTRYREVIGDLSYEVAFESAPRNRPPDTSVTVPPEHFFVIGDNRFNARDSRYFGPISFNSIIAKKL